MISAQIRCLAKGGGGRSGRSSSGAGGLLWAEPLPGDAETEEDVRAEGEPVAPETEGVGARDAEGAEVMVEGEEDEGESDAEGGSRDLSVEGSGDKSEGGSEESEGDAGLAGTSSEGGVSGTPMAVELASPIIFPAPPSLTARPAGWTPEAWGDALCPTCIKVRRVAVAWQPRDLYRGGRRPMRWRPFRWGDTSLVVT